MDPHKAPREGTRMTPTPPILTAAEALAQVATVDLAGPSFAVASRILNDTAAGKPLWWCGFADYTTEKDNGPDRPSVLGIVIVAGTNIVDALQRTHDLGINPGGIVRIDGPLPADAVDPEWHDRLLTAADAERIPTEPVDAALGRYLSKNATRPHVCPECGFASIPLTCSRCGTTRPVWRRPA
jgi:hypothetical protein